MTKIHFRPYNPNQTVRYLTAHNLSLRKTYYFFLLIENKEFTKIFSLTGNDLETSELLHSAMFCTNQKNAFLIRKSNVFLFCCQNNFIEKRRKSDF